jgi:hypothetical protein
MVEPTPEPTAGPTAEPVLEPVRDPHSLRVGFGPFSADPHVLIYSTIILMTAYALWDEGTARLGDGTWFELIAISLAPLFALAMAHAFSDALDFQIRHGRRLTMRDRRHLLAKNLAYMYVALPPSLLLIVLTLLDWNANDAVDLMLLLGLITLFIWGMYAGRQAGVSRLRRLSFGMSYMVMGLFVLLVELALTH